MAEEKNERAISLDRILLIISLCGGGYGTYLGTAGTEDRYYGSQGRAQEVRTEYLEKRLVKLEQRQDTHLDTHPDRGLQIQINELREELIRQGAEK